MGAKTILRGPELPARLLDLEEPPTVLYLRGELPRGPAVALVGTRHPTREGRRFASELARDLARAGVAIISGGAEGIDRAAHVGALAAGAFTLVVAPAGFQRPFPKRHERLFRRIVSHGGAYASLVPDDKPAPRHGFFARNACLVALAHAVVVVEAPVRSGARNAAKWARSIGRPLFAVPAAPWNSKGKGCNQELRLGARVAESARDILRELSAAHLHPIPVPGPSWAAGPAAPPPQMELALGQDDEIRLLRAVAKGAGHPDEICASTGLTVGRVQGLVLTLTLKGALVPAPDGRLRVVAQADGPATSTQEPETIG
ncbi:MAG TPA: DNA-processing protein DprA [Polyangiaceae bacterium]|nr:DNA-processing protein DprA [Polyangiaceae bacterium]